MSSWGCPHEVNGSCEKVNRLPCDPGMKGCVLRGRVTFSNPSKNPTVGPGVRSQPEAKGDEPRPSK